jgi:hypothetical protein
MYVNAKMILAETVPGIRRGRNEGEGYQVWYIWYIIRTFVNTTAYPYTA